MTAVDPDQPASSLYVLLLENGNGQTLGSNASLQLYPNFVSHQDVIYCVGVATDASGLSSTASDSITISNTPPELPTSPSLPNHRQANQQPHFIVSGVDIDGEAITYVYQWK